MDVERWRRKPYVVEAVKWDGTKDMAEKIIHWLACRGREAHYLEPHAVPSRAGGTAFISGPFLSLAAGTRVRAAASRGDYVVIDSEGYPYPRNGRLFEAEHEPAGPPQEQSIPLCSCGNVALYAEDPPRLGPHHNAVPVSWSGDAPTVAP